MGEKDELIKVGRYNTVFNEALGISLEELEIYQSKGLKAHMIKRKHFTCLKYIENIPDIIMNPDYVGVNPNESGTSVEFIKRYDDNVLLGIKLDSNENYFYVSTMFDIQETKIERRLYSGRIKEIHVDNSKE